MCWMSAYVNTKSTKPYTYTTKTQSIDITKVIYADDGTYFQQTRTAAQNVLKAVATFSTATGIIVKPQKSYAYSTCDPTQPLVIDTYTGYSKNTGELTGKVRTEIKELKDTDFYKHLGNIQNALGDNPIKPTQLYDGSYTENIYEKINRELKALKSRNITAGGALQAIKTVIYRQILYPMTYASTSNAELGNFKRIIDNAMRYKFKMPSHLHTDTLYMHEDAGGIGQDEIEDLVNIERLVLLVNCLNQTGEMHTIMQGAVEELQEYAKVSTNPLQTNITHYVDNPKGVWIFQLKQWMEKNEIEIPEEKHNTQGTHACIMDVCTRKTCQRDIWRWARKHKLKHVSDMMYPDGTIREYLFHTEQTIRSSVIEQTARWRAENGNTIRQHGETLTLGRWVETNDGKVGEIIESNANTKMHKQITVEIYEQMEKKQLVSRYHKKTGETITIDEGRCAEVKMHRTANGEIKITHMNEDNKIKESGREESDRENRQRDDDKLEEPEETPGGLASVTMSEEALQELRWHAQNENNVIAGASDGSVRDYRKQGTWAWTLMTQYEPQPWGIQGKGREWVTGSETQETHSYRTEAIGLLSALTFIRTELRWKGKVSWHMDSKSVIDTFKTCHQHNQTKWVKQRDKDVWRELTEEKKRWGKNRIQLHHVAAHADEKYKKGLRGPPTPIERVNMYVDKLADSVYTDYTVQGLQTAKLRKYGQRIITYKKQEVTGHWRNQIKEQIRMERTKRRASKDNTMWGNCPEEIDWGRMRKTSGNKTIKERIAAAKLMGGRRATNVFLQKFGITHTTTCSMCGEAKETNRHILCYCTNKNIQNARTNAGIHIVAQIKEAGGGPELCKIVKKIYSNNESGRATNMYGRMYNKTGETSKLAFPVEWHTAWRKGKTKETRTWLEEGQARAAEIAITLGGATPLWTGNITKAWIWLLEWGNVKPQKMTKLIRGIRDTLKQFATVTWKYRCKVNEIAIVQHKTEDATYSTKMAKQFVKQMRLQGQFTPNQILQLSAASRMKLRNRITKQWEETTVQQSLLKLDFKIVEDAQNYTPPAAVTGKRDISSVIQQAKHSTTWKQTALPQLFGADSVTPQKKKKENPKPQHKRKYDPQQLTLLEKWNIKRTCKDKRTTTPAKQHTTKRCRGKRDDVCAKCKKGGELVECDTCSQCRHPGCDQHMPANVWQKNAAYQCPTCRQENMREQIKSTPNNTYKNKPQHKQTNKETLHCDQTKFNVESDSDEEYTSNTDPRNQKLGKRKLGKRLRQNRTKRVATCQQSTLKSNQTSFDADTTGKHDPSLEMKHTEVPRKRKLETRIHNIHDKDRQGRPTLGIPIQDRCLQNHITTYLKATVLYALGDGHCLRRSLGKIENISPGEVVAKMKMYCQNVLDTQTILYIDGQEWYHRLANPPDHWIKLETSVRSYTDIFAGISELHIWAIITQKPIITLNATTGTATVFTPDKKVPPKVYNNPQQAHEKTRDQYTTPPGYVLYNNVNHYNAILTQTQREEHAQQQPSKLQKMSNQSKTNPTREEKPAETKKRTLSSFFDKTLQHKKQRKNTVITKDGTGAGTPKNDNSMVQSTIMAQTTATTAQEDTTTRTDAMEIEPLIHRGSKIPLATHIQNRVTKVIGKTITEALTTLVMTNKGTQTRYKKADLEYDKSKQFITIQDTNQMKATKSTRQETRLQETQPLTKDEWRRKWKFK